MNTASISGLVLAGGRGTRMGTVDKGLQPFGGSTMVAHVLDRLRPQVASMAINANQNLVLGTGGVNGRLQSGAATAANVGWAIEAAAVGALALCYVCFRV